jgi:predicted heme/steroid binding protein
MSDLRPNPAQSHNQLTVGASAQNLSQLGLDVHPDTVLMQFYVEGGDVRVTVNGTVPTVSLGILWPAGSLWELGAAEAAALKVIRAGAPATLQVAAFKD